MEILLLAIALAGLLSAAAAATGWDGDASAWPRLRDYPTQRR